MSLATLKNKVEQLVELAQNGGGGEDTVKAQLEAQKDWDYFCYGGARTDIINNNPSITKNGESFMYMYSTCGDEVLPVHDTSKGETFSYMYNDCEYMIEAPKIDTSNGVMFVSMFNGCTSLEKVDSLDTSRATHLTSLFYGCNSLTKVPVIDISNATVINSMFWNCYALEEFPTITGESKSLNSATNMFNGSAINSVTNLTLGSPESTSTTLNALNCFANCSDLETVDTIKVFSKTNTTVTTMFQECTSLKYIKHLEIPRFYAGANLFKNCSALTTIDYLDIGSANTAVTASAYNNVFAGCESLTTINSLKTGMFNATMFQGCPNLTTCILTNEVRVKTTNSLNLSYCPNLTVESIMSFVNNITRNTSSTKYNIVFGETNLAKLTDEQKQILIDKNYNLT